MRLCLLCLTLGFLAPTLALAQPADRLTMEQLKELARKARILSEKSRKYQSQLQKKPHNKIKPE